MKTEELIVQLARAAGPVRRLPSPAVRFWRWAAVVIGTSLCAGLAFGWRGDLSAVLIQPVFLVLAVASIAAAGLAAAAAFTLSVPGAERSRIQRWWPWFAVAGWLAINATVIVGGGATAVSGEALHAACVARVAAIALVPGVAIVVMLARAAPIEAFWTSALAALAAASTALATIQFICPYDGPVHALGSHFAPAVGFLVLAAVIGQRHLTSWQRPGVGRA